MSQEMEIVPQFEDDENRPRPQLPSAEEITRITYLATRSDGGTSVFQLLVDHEAKFYPTIEDEVAKWEEVHTMNPGDVLHGVTITSWMIVDVPEAKLPAHQVWLQDAWRPTPDGNVVVDMDKAKEIYMSVLRSVRNVRLRELDTPFMIACEDDNPSDKVKIAALKRILRNLPETIKEKVDEAGTVGDLQLAWPHEQLGKFPFE